MGEWADSLRRIRRLLRDPAPGKIWTDDELRQYFNDAAYEIAQQVGTTTRVETYYFPPEYDCSYTYDWEDTYIEGTCYQCWMVNQADGTVITYPWEHSYWLDNISTSDDGPRCSHPWEMCMGSPADVVPIPIHSKFDHAKAVFYDEEPIDPIDEPTLASQDGYYRTREGKPSNYYRLDEMQNRLVLYPRPSPVWDETEIYEVMDDAGGMNLTESWLDRQPQGITTDIINTTNTMLMVYEAMPVEVQDYGDVPDLPPYAVKYAEYGALERAYSADTDGFIPSLRDYWALRKKIGIEALKKWKRLSLLNRNYRLGGSMPKTRGRVTLPEHYPPVI